MPVDTLQKQISLALSSELPSSMDDATKSTAIQKREETATKIAKAVEEYVREQIGLRLSLILEAITIPIPSPNGPISVEPEAGQKFVAFTRK
jgi:hypothetical protein